MVGWMVAWSQGVRGQAAAILALGRSWGQGWDTELSLRRMGPRAAGIGVRGLAVGTDLTSFFER